MIIAAFSWAIGYLIANLLYELFTKERNWYRAWDRFYWAGSALVMFAIMQTYQYKLYGLWHWLESLGH